MTPEKLADMIDNRPDNAIIHGDKAAAELRRLAAIENKANSYIIDNARLAAENAALRKAMDRYSEAEMLAERQGEAVAWHNPVATAVRDESPAPVRDPLHDDIQSVLFEVEQAIENGCCPWQIEAAFEAYEAARRLQQPAHGIGGEK